jgi:uncharacterized protein YycO
VECAEKAAQYAKEFLEKEVLFDHDYNLNDSTKMYCSEMIWRAYMRAGRDITDQRRTEVRSSPIYNGTYILPSDVYQNEYLTIVYVF